MSAKTILNTPTDSKSLEYKNVSVDLDLATAVKIVRRYLSGMSIREVAKDLELKRWIVAVVIKGTGISRNYTSKAKRQKVRRSNRIELRRWIADLLAHSSLQRLKRCGVV